MPAGVIIVFGPGFGGNGIGNGVDQRNIPGGRHADGLRENGCDAGAGHAMETLVPIIISRHAQPRNGRGGIAQLRGFLGEGQPPDEIFHARFDGQSGVFPEFRAGDDRGFRQGIVRDADQIRRFH